MKNTFHASRLSLLSVAFLALSSFGLAQQKAQPAGAGGQSALVQTVREATKQYLDINNAIAEGYGQFLGCVSGSDHGAMGIHYVNFTLLNAFAACLSGCFSATADRTRAIKPLTEVSSGPAAPTMAASAKAEIRSVGRMCFSA